MRAGIVSVAVLLLVVPWGTVASQAPQTPGVPGAPTRPGAPVPGVPVPAPSPGLPPRDAVARADSGTGVIRGQVVSLETGQPLRRVQVRALGQGQPPTTRITVTDDDGRFELAELPAREYQLTASRGGYVTLQYGQRRPFEPGRPIVLGEGETIASLRMALPRGGVITGRVVDEFGEPVTGAMIQASRYRYVSGERVLAQVVTSGSPISLGMGGGGTDDRGEFRLYGVPPGDYFVSADLGLLVGTVASTDQTPGYVTTYYPGTVSPATAQIVRVGIGSETGGIVFALVASRSATVSGMVFDADGRPAQATLSLQQAIGGTGSRSRSAGSSRPDGSFTIAGLAPGEYTIEARPTGAAAGRRGAIDVLVSGADLAGLTIALAAPVTMRGRVVVNGGPPPATLRPSDVRLQSRPVPRTFLFGGGTATLAPDWTFEVANLLGHGRIQVQVPSGWALRRILHQGVDVTDTRIDYSRGGLADVIVELTQDMTELSGTVTDARGQGTRDYALLVFADDPARWAPPSRFIRAARPDDSGRFQLRGLPPGRYLAVALSYLEEGAEADLDRLEQLRHSGAASSITLREGEARPLTLTLREGV